MAIGLGALLGSWALPAGADEDNGLKITVAQRWKVAGNTGGWTPYLVTVRNDGPGNFNGEVGLVPTQTPRGSPPYDSIPRYRGALSVPARTQRTAAIYVIETPGGYHAELYDAQGRVAGRADPDPASRAGSALAILSDHPAAAQRIGAPLNALGQIGVALSRFTPAQPFPTNAVYLSGLNGVIIDQFDSGSLNGAQVQALKDFVGLGGTLIEAGGASWRRTLAPLPRDLLPMRPAETSTASLSSLTELAGLTTNPSAPVVTGQVASWGRAPVVTPDGVPLIVEGAYGAGRVVELAFDPLGEPFDAQVELAAMSWSQAISRGLSGARGGSSWSRFAVNGPSQPNALAGSGPGTWSPYPGYLDPVFNDFSAASMPPFGLLAVLLVAYGLLVSLLSYVLLKVMGRRGLLWATVPALAIACTATAYEVGFGPRGSDYQLTQLQVMRLGPEGVVETGSFGGVFSPRRGDVRVSSAPNTLVSTAVALYSWSGTRGQETVISVGSRPEVLLSNVSVWDMRRVQTLSVTHPSGGEPGQALPIEARLKVSHGRLVGQITNHTSRTVRDLRLSSLSGSQAELVATLPPGATAAVDAQLTPGQSGLPLGKFGVPGQGMVTGPSSSENARQAAMAIATSASSSRPGDLVLVGFTDPADTLQVEGRRPTRRVQALVAEPVELQSADSLSGITPTARLVSNLSASVTGPLDVYELDLPQGLTGRVGLNLVAAQGIQPAVYSVDLYDWNLRSWRQVPVQIAPGPGLTATATPLTGGETAEGVVRLRMRENTPGQVLISATDLK